ncbi:MAG: hypothetical protein AB7L09_12310 [Nitrospira sp.]
MPEFVVYHGLDAAGHQSRVKELVPQGYRPISLCVVTRYTQPCGCNVQASVGEPCTACWLPSTRRRSTRSWRKATLRSW